MTLRQLQGCTKQKWTAYAKPLGNILVLESHLFRGGRCQNIITNQKHTVASIAREAGMSDSTLRNLVDLKTSFNPRLNVLTKLSQALGFDVYHALFFKGNFLAYIQSKEKKSLSRQEFIEQRLPKI